MVLYQSLSPLITLVMFLGVSAIALFLLGCLIPFQRICNLSVVYFKTAREAWLDLQHRFSQGNGPCIFELKSRFVLWLKKI